MRRFARMEVREAHVAAVRLCPERAATTAATGAVRDQLPTPPGVISGAAALMCSV